MPLIGKNLPSRDYFQLKFDGFSVGGRTKIYQFLYSIKLFAKALSFYFVIKFNKLVTGFINGAFLSWKFAHATKDLFIAKLIWSRGRLGRPVATFVVMTIAFLIFLFGEIFSNTKFVSSQEISPDYLATSTDIIPQKNIALTAIPEDRKRSESFIYVVQGGDTLSGIGEKFRISTDALKYINRLTDYSVLSVGQELTIPPVSGLIHEVESGDTLLSIARKYDVPSQAIADFNYILDTSKLAIGTELVIPGGSVPEQVVLPPMAPIIPGYPGEGYAPVSPSSSFCAWPTSVWVITQYFSWYHNGVDIATPHGTAMPPLYACTGGTVTRSGWDPWGLGLHVQIDHGNGYETVYGHMSRIDVGYGEYVNRGQVIGLMGNTGRSTGSHVHFMVKYNGIPQNPLDYAH